LFSIFSTAVVRHLLANLEDVLLHLELESTLLLKHQARKSGIRNTSGILVPMRPQPLICVSDVEASSRWYQRLLGLRSCHGGRAYEQLVLDGRLILQLHSFEVEHHHGAIGNPAHKPYGNGVLLWFEVDDFDAVFERAQQMKVEMVKPRHRNPPDDDNGGPNHWECWMRDPDGYLIVVASPYGTADGDWKPEGNPFGNA